MKCGRHILLARHRRTCCVMSTSFDLAEIHRQAAHCRSMAATTREPFRSQWIMLSEQYSKLIAEAERLKDMGQEKAPPQPGGAPAGQ